MQAEAKPKAMVGLDPNYYCQYCDAFFSGDLQQKEHELGKKHRKKVAESQVVLPADTARPIAPGVSVIFRCESCDMYFSGPDQHAAHNMGRKHKANAAKLCISLEAATTEVVKVDLTPCVATDAKKRKTEEPGENKLVAPAPSSSLPSPQGTVSKNKKKTKLEKYWNSLGEHGKRNVTAYASHFLPLIELEIQEEMLEARRKLNTFTLQRLLEDGLTMLNMSVSPHRVHKDYHRKTPSESVFRAQIPSVGLAPDLPHHDMCPGDVLWLSHDMICPMSNQNQYAAAETGYYATPSPWSTSEEDQRHWSDPVTTKRYLEAVCIFRARNQLVFTVDLEDQPKDLYDLEPGWENMQMAENEKVPRKLSWGPATLAAVLERGFDSGWRIDKGVSRIAYDRMKDAIVRITGPKYEGHPAFREVVCRIKARQLDLSDPTFAYIQGTREEEAPVPEKTVVEDWNEAVSPEGWPYYYNLKTGEVSWLKPQASASCSDNPAANPMSKLLFEQEEKDMKLAPGLNAVDFPDDIRLKVLEVLTQMPLNESQREAVVNCLGSRLSLIQGPPGTGKTTTAVYLLATYFKVFGKGPILATAFSNIAVDQIMHGLSEQGIKCVRIGNATKVSEHLRGNTISELTEQHPDYPEVKRQVEEVKALTAQSNALGAGAGLPYLQSRKELATRWKKIRKLEEMIQCDVLKHAEVVCATCVGAGTPCVQGLTYPLVVVDECTQATEPACLIPLVQSVGRVVLIGDQCQLPPTLSSEKLKHSGLQLSLFERMIAPIGGDKGNFTASYLRASRDTEMGVIPSLLKVQYRMHPLIAQWPNAMFYGGCLSSAVGPQDRIPPRGIPWPRGQPVLFVMGNQLEDASMGTTKCNTFEANLAKACVDQMLEMRDVHADEIGIITPYAGQVSTLRRLFGCDRHGVTHSSSRYEGLEINSVDGYQGREKDVIVFSCVRSNHEGSVGFLADVRRLNVAITRAKRGLIVIGSPATLRKNSTWAAYMQFMEENGLVVGGNQLFQIFAHQSGSGWNRGHW